MTIRIGNSGARTSVTGTPIPRGGIEREARRGTTLVVERWPREQMEAYLAEKYGTKAIKP